MAEVLELAQLLQDDGVAEVDVGRRRVQPELHAQRTARPELALELAAGRRRRRCGPGTSASGRGAMGRC